MRRSAPATRRCVRPLGVGDGQRPRRRHGPRARTGASAGSLRRLAPGQTGCLAAGRDLHRERPDPQSAGSRSARPAGAAPRSAARSRSRAARRGVTLSQLAVRGPRSRRGADRASCAATARACSGTTSPASRPRRAASRASPSTASPARSSTATRSTSARARRAAGSRRPACSRGGRAARRIANNFVYARHRRRGRARRRARLVVHHNLVDGNVSGVVLRERRVVEPDRQQHHLARGPEPRALDGRPAGGPHEPRRRELPLARLPRQPRRRRARLPHGGNLVASPRFVNRPRTFRLRAGPVLRQAAVRDPPLRRAAALSAPPRRTRPGAPAAPPPPQPHSAPRRRPARPARVVPAFRVRYRLLALPGSVRVVALTLVGLSRACADPGRVRERVPRRRTPLRVRRDGTASIARFRGRHARARHGHRRPREPSRRVGHVARITVTGLPRGVRIDHGCLPPSGVPVLVPCAAYG